MVKPVKRERDPGSKGPAATAENGGDGGGGESTQDVTERRVLRSRYLAVKSVISDERDDITRGDSDKFSSIITEVESLHQHVQKPREQVADAEALLDIANTLVTSVKSQSNDGLSPADFVTALLKKFGQEGGLGGEKFTMVSWKDVGLSVSQIFRRVPGCCTMIGPMDSEMKQRKAVVQRKRTKPTESSRPEQLEESELEEKTDTDKNMSTMFDILRKKRGVRLENLVLNRTSFAQTVENIFALSFLVKDGRAEISTKDNGHHLVSPRNAPAASAIASGTVSYNHFVFRFDFKDWKLMVDTVRPGEEVMPHRCAMNTPGISQAEASRDTMSAAPTTPIRKLTRNRGLVIQEQAVVEDTRDKDTSGGKATPPRRRKRLCLENDS